MRWVVAVLAVASVAEAAPHLIHGVVLNGTTPVEGATILTDHGELTATDADGYFTLALDARDHTITVLASGYQNTTVRVDEDLVHIQLDKAQGAEVIEVYGRAPEETKPLSYQLTADEIRSIPGAMNDVLRAAQILPGVARIPYAFGGLVLRGTSPRDTEIYLDGIEVPIAFHFGGVTSFYPSPMLSDLNLVAGGFDASYGRAQGGLVTLTTREPRTDRWRVGGEVGLLDSGAYAEGPLWGGGVLVGVRRSYFDTVAMPFVSSDTPLPAYWDFQLRTSFGDPRVEGRITPMIFGSIDRVASDTISVTSAFLRVAAPYLRQWGPTTLRITPWLGINELSFEEAEGGGENDEFSRPTYPGGVRADLTRDYSFGHIAGGLDLQGGHLAHTQVNVTGIAGDADHSMDGSTTATWVDLAAWGEARIKLDGDRFAIKPGLRIERFGLTDEVVIDPRLNIHQQLSDTVTIRQAIGRYHQPPTPADVDPLSGNPNLKSSYTDQLSLGVDKVFSPTTMASITGYFDYGRNLGVRVAPDVPGATPPAPEYGGLGPTFELLLEKQLGFPIYRGNVGRARSYGLEVLIKHNAGPVFAILSYTLSKSERTDDPAGIPNQITGKIDPYLGWRPFELDQTHNLNLAVGYRWEHWQLGARLQVVSGNPYSPNVLTVRGGQAILTQDPWAGNLPTFVSLDVRADRRWHRCWGDIDLFFDIQNVTNHDNVEGRDFDSSLGKDTDTPGLPIIPFIGVEFIPK